MSFVKYTFLAVRRYRLDFAALSAAPAQCVLAGGSTGEGSEHTFAICQKRAVRVGQPRSNLSKEASDDLLLTFLPRLALKQDPPRDR